MRLYKAVITDIPDEAKINFYEQFKNISAATDSPEEWGYQTWDDAETLIQDPGWKPAGWEEFLDEFAPHASWAEDLRTDDCQFVWPNMGGMFQSRSSAVARAKRAERWGATVTIMEAEVGEFIPVAEANARRKARRDQVRVEKLRAKIRAIEGDNVPAF